MPIDELRVNINSRRDKIFLLMEELRRLRIQQRLKVNFVFGGAGRQLIERRLRSGWPATEFQQLKGLTTLSPHVLCCLCLYTVILTDCVLLLFGSPCRPPPCNQPTNQPTTG